MPSQTTSPAKNTLLNTVKETSWALKHVDSSRDASLPLIDPNMKVNLTIGRLRRNSLMLDIGKGSPLKVVAVSNDFSAPEIPNPIVCPHSAEIRSQVAKRFAATNNRSWILLSYRQLERESIVLEDSGDGGLQEVSLRFKNTAVNYCLLRTPLCDRGAYRDIVLIWMGPDVPEDEQARKTLHFGAVCLMLKPHDATVIATEREPLSEANLIACSGDSSDPDTPALLHGISSAALGTNWVQDLSSVNMWFS